jgi:uncharacterized protein (TIGR02757 family)
MNRAEAKRQLDRKVAEFNSLEFIESDPIQIPHAFTEPFDIEISGLLTALISWGRRDIIIKSAKEMLRRMDNAPYAFVRDASAADLSQLRGFVHRTFNASDLEFLILGLRNLYSEGKGLEPFFLPNQDEADTNAAIDRFRRAMLRVPHELRSEKHLASPQKGSAAKRLHMFLRWMVRRDTAGVDFGMWETIPTAKLLLPLDVHTGRVARELGILKRKMNDRVAVEEVMKPLRKWNPEDPVAYDFALFGMGMELLNQK